MQDIPPQTTIETQEIRVVDAQGHPRITLSAKDGEASFILVRKDGSTAATVRIDQQDRPSVTLSNPDANSPTAAFEIDDKGAHIRFDRPGGASSYLFLNNAGASGVVLIDAVGARRSSVVLSPDGSLAINRGGVPSAKP